MESEDHSEVKAKQKNIFQTKKGRLVAVGVGIASVLAAVGFQVGKNSLDSNSAPVDPQIENTNQDDRTISEWQEEAKARLKDHSKVLPDEKIIERAIVVAGKNRGEIIRYQTDGGVIATKYPGLLPDLNEPPAFVKIPADAVIHNGIIRQGENMRSRYEEGSEIEYKFIYFNCKDIEGEIYDLNNEVVDQNLIEDICSIPADYVKTD